MTSNGIRPRGRPRDPDIERRAIDAVLQLYSDLGLAGVSFEAVARRASVGKAALYSRWDSVEELLIAGLVHVAPPPVTVDTGDVAEDLRQLIHILIDLYTGPWGNAVVRINLDASVVAALRPHYDSFSNSYIKAARAIARRGVERGQLRPDLSITTMLEQLFGATMLHVHYSDPERRKIQSGEAARFATGLVDQLLGGTRLDPKADGPTWTREPADDDGG